MTDPGYFDAMYGAGPDPWGFEQHWYEKRKRDLTVAALPRARYADALELGSSTGVLSEVLLDRCERLTCVELHPRGVETARRRLAAAADRVRLEVGDIVTWRPSRHHDLVVVSEVLYYLADEDLDSVMTWLADCSRAGATLVAVHFRHPVPEHVRSGDDVHEHLRRHLGAPMARYRDDDVVLDVFPAPGERSVAVSDGLAPDR
ncbi:SAM-dependent methyltransferase [Williamsia deligens]|uniref:SAM-dependent methyltransferase n=1 Tax=Williamsia deligens TaxID=321325 RepID=A0ABW3G5S6_9NOCA|nr:SAM-dependent methyltransferase [Williamsia deligens]MCP2193801.1 Nodulation protein S (NodS) [Williamsia deligens]